MSKLIRALMIVGAGLWLVGCTEGRDAFAVTTTDTIVTFDTEDANKITNEAPITGLDEGETLQQIDYRVADERLYGITSSARIVTVDPETGVTTRVGTGPITGSDDLRPLSNIVLDVNPQFDYLRVIATRPAVGGGSGANEYFNARISPTDGTVTMLDSTTLAFNENDDNLGEIPTLVGIAHTNNQDDATSTTEYGLELTTQTLVRVTTSGLLSTIDNVGQGFTANAGFDIVRDRGDNDGDDGIAFVALSDANGDARLYRFDLTDGSTSNSQAIGNNLQIRSLAVSLRPPKRDGFNIN